MTFAEKALVLVNELPEEQDWSEYVLFSEGCDVDSTKWANTNEDCASLFVLFDDGSYLSGDSSGVTACVAERNSDVSADGIHIARWMGTEWKLTV